MLNGKELMVGDYVDLSNNDSNIVLGIVKGLFTKWNGYFIGIDEIGKDKNAAFEHCRTGEEIQPILLSEEFFLQNGFVKLYADKHIVRLYNHDNRLRVNVYPPENFTRFRVGGIDINYVHEFQHYLRLVNLSDYANNLKI